MPLNALLRNLGSLTEIGVLSISNQDNLTLVKSKLTDKQYLKKAYVHPLDVLKALKVYQSGGFLGKGKNWIPVPYISDVLEKTLELSFDCLEPTGKSFIHALDVSGSMNARYGYGYSGGNSVKSPFDFGMTCAEVAAVMALACAKTEEFYHMVGFADKIVTLDIKASDSFHTAFTKTVGLPLGGTDASKAYDWAIKNNVKADVFCFWTDSESWAGYRHPFQALTEYRKRVNPNAKAVYTTLAANRLSLADVDDPMSFEQAGFDPSIPKLIQEVALLN
jgi:60 kDa SS-A/Ro ribonucleoprotein